MNRRTASILLMGLSFAALCSAQSQSPTVQRLISAKNEETRRGSREEDLGPLSETIERVERAFETGDPDELDQCLSEKKVYLSLRARGAEAGYYGKSQVKFMLKKLFEERRTDSFDRGEIEVTRGDSAAFRAEWSYVGPEADDVVTEELRFQLDRDKGPQGARSDAWRVSEIRAQSR